MKININIKTSIIILRLLILVILNISLVIHAQTSSLKFHKIAIGKGFSENEISSILQDRMGFIWFATRAGIYKYDGNSFTSYKNNPRNSNSLSNNYVNAIVEDINGNIWIATNDGLNKFEPYSGKFTRFKYNHDDSSSISDNIIKSICEDKSGTLWIGTKNGLNSFNKKTEEFYYFPNLLGEENCDINVIYEDKLENLWIGTSSGSLFLLNQKNEEIKLYKYKLEIRSNLKFNKILSIYEDRNENLWIGTFENLQKFDRVTKTFTHYNLKNAILNNPSLEYEKEISEFLIHSIVEDNSGLLWISSQNGLYQFNSIKEQFTYYKHVSNNPTSISSDFITELFVDNSGILWLGTYGYGVNKLYPSIQNFEKYSYQNVDENKLRVKSIRSISEGRDGSLWIGGYDGLDKIDREAKIIRHFLDEEPIYSILHDPDNPDEVLWIGKDVGGLCRYNLLTGKYKQYKYENSKAVSGEIIYSMLISKDGTFWIGTEKGLNKFDRFTEKSILYEQDSRNPNSLSNNNINVIYEDKYGFLWIGTDVGLNVFNPKTEVFFHYLHDSSDPFSLSYNNILSIHEDKNDQIWIGTNGGGLNRFERETGLFHHYSTKNGLINDVVYGILEDEVGNFWLSTNNGISKLNYPEESFLNFDEKYELQDSEFNKKAFFKSNKGEMFFGGISGFNAFFPANILDNQNITPVIITNFQLANKTVPIGEMPDGRVILEKPISETKEITLSYTDYVFSFEYASLEYFSPEKTRYAYLLEGLDKEWNYVGNRRFATYNTIPAGDYTFRVKALDNGDGNETEASVRVFIPIPFWESIWFRFLIGLIILGAIYLIFRFRIEQLLRVEKVRIKLASDLHDEVGSTLSKISMQAEIVKHGIDPQNTKENLSRISELSGSAINTMRDIVWSIDSRNDSAESLLNRMKDEVYSLLRNKNITVKFHAKEINLEQKLSIETRQNIYLILKEAINNIYKHSNATEVEISLLQRKSILKMVISDNGNNYVKNGNSSSHGLRNMKMRARSIGGSFSFDNINGFKIIISDIKLK